MNSGHIPNWLALIIFLAVTALGGVLGEQDYQDQRYEECSHQGKGYNIEADLCVKQVTSNK